VTLRIGFDLDGVLADMESELVRQAEELFGDVMTRRLQERAAEPEPEPGAAGGEPPEKDAGSDAAPPLVKLNMTVRQQRKLWRHVASIENFWETLHEVEPGVVARLAAIAARRRWEIIFLTKRPETLGATAQRQSQQWLQLRGFPLPSVFVVQGSRGLVAAALELDVVVDDRPENCLDVVVDSKARAVLVWRDDEKQLPIGARRLGIGVVKSVAECLDILDGIGPPAADRPGMLDRVKRLLGLNEPANA
jgi:hypothetical protein